MCQRCAEQFDKTAAKLLRELEANYLEVVLIPAREARHNLHMVRCVQSQNAKWYQDFCGQYQSRRKDRLKWRKFKTKIKRRETRWALEGMIEGKAHSLYAQRLRDFMRDRRHPVRRSFTKPEHRIAFQLQG